MSNAFSVPNVVIPWGVFPSFYQCAMLPSWTFKISNDTLHSCDSIWLYTHEEVWFLGTPAPCDHRAEVGKMGGVHGRENWLQGPRTGLQHSHSARETCFLRLTPWSPEPAGPWALWAPSPGGEGKKSLSGSLRRGSALLGSLLKEKTTVLRSHPMCVWATRNSTTLIKIRDQQVGLIYYLQKKPPSICIII